MNLEENKIVKSFWNEFQRKTENYIKSKFLSGRKSFRTGFVKKAFGKYYPKEAYFYSKALDEYTSAMDDIYDDSKMNREEVRINIFLIHKIVMNMLLWPSKIRKIAYEHYEKMIRIAVIQDITNYQLNKIKKEENAIEIALKNYEGRAIDIDFAIEIALYFLKFRKKERELILDAGRIFRGINLFFKDIRDLQHDIFHETKTPIVIFHNKGFNIHHLKNRIYENSIEKIKELKEKTKNEITYKIIKNFEKMIKNEIK